jgi:TolB-like protein
MTTVLDSHHGVLAPDDIRVAVERIVASSVFARSPQLGAFLRFVVEAVLHGKADRIKAYTIGVEVLRRDTNFDPQADPIVRVEATRLRRALERYYTGPGADDPIIVDLPRGSYVPTFRRGDSDRRARLWFHRALGDLSAAVGQRPALAVLVGLAVVALLLLGDAVLYRASRPELAPTGITARSGAGPHRLPAGNGMPVVAIEAMRVLGQPTSRPIAADLLHAKIRDAFARFDTINVASPATDQPKTTGAAVAASAVLDEPRASYRLSGTVEYVGDLANAWFTLTDVADGNIVWSRTFERVGQPGGQGTSEDGIVITLTNSLLQSYGVIRSRDRAKQLATGVGDPRYRCVLEAADAIRTADRREHDRARSCLEQLTALDPGFAVGFTLSGADLQSGIPARLSAAAWRPAAVRTRAAGGAPIGQPAPGELARLSGRNGRSVQSTRFAGCDHRWR